MRGNLSGAGFHAPDARSIPAYAGEPSFLRWRADFLTVYPRVCGGTRPAPHRKQ